MNIDLGRAAWWPLRTLGLDPGRALANAQLSAAEVQARRDELRAMVMKRFPRPESPARLPGRAG